MPVRLLVVASVMFGPGCSLFGPSCLDRQERRPVATIQGAVGAGELAMHRVQYDTRGSQNDAEVMWGAEQGPEGPQLRIYATRATCEEFRLPANENSGACAVLASAGWTPQGVARTAIVTHGRGNPERLGTPPEYKLWITSDTFTSYTISITSVFGPDC